MLLVAGVYNKSVVKEAQEARTGEFIFLKVIIYVIFYAYLNIVYEYKATRVGIESWCCG